MLKYEVEVSTKVVVEAKDDDEAVEKAASEVAELKPDDFNYETTIAKKFPNPDAITDIRKGWWF